MREHSQTVLNQTRSKKIANIEGIFTTSRLLMFFKINKRKK